MLEPDQTEPSYPGFSSVLHTVDPGTVRQLTTGFYDPEPFGRWTKPKFSIMLRIPHAPELFEPALLVNLYIPDDEMKRLKSVTLSATVNGVALGPATFTTAGRQVYVRRIPAPALTGDRARVEFALDRWLPADGPDGRELGIVVTSAGLKNTISPEF